jgi:uncharacterized protein YndB with AHSA1/START domain
MVLENENSPIVQRSVELDASVEEVWCSITEADHLREWFAPEVELDVIAGGAGHFVDDDGVARTAVVEDICLGERLSFRWWPDESGPVGSTVVTLVVAPRPGGTRLFVTERALTAVASAASRRSWTWRLDLLLLHTGLFVRA